MSSTPAIPVTRTAIVLLLAALLVLGALPAGAQVSERIAPSDDPVTGAIQISQSSFTDGNARRVVLGRSDVFADNLAGAAATGAEGPLLLVDPAPEGLAGDVLTEIQRVVGDRSATQCDQREEDVLVLGGTAAIDESVIGTLEASGYCPIRLAGNGRVETSVEVASYLLSQFLTPDVSRGTLFIATGGNAADSASASAYAASIGAPIVVTERDSLNPAVADLLQPGDTAWDQVYLLGGVNALTTEVEDQVVNALDERTVTTRIAGSTRDDTAFVVATELWGGARDGAATVLGFGETFWQTALPAAAAAARLAAPLLYVQTDSVPGPTDLYLRQFVSNFLLTYGSEARISEETRFEAESSLGSGMPGGM
ncbi:hypothetical protein BH23ACT9_BH23ACT9_26870 [soil metagenome]